MKVCHVVPFFSVKHYGGTSTVLIQLCRQQVRDGMQPVVLTSEYLFDAETADTLEGVRFVTCPSIMNELGFRLMPGLSRRARKVIADVDVVHFHLYRAFQTWAVAKVCQKLGKPYVMDPHGNTSFGGRKLALKRLFDKLVGRSVLRRAGALIGETAKTLAEYQQILPDMDLARFHELALVIDEHEFATMPPRGAFRDSLGIPPERFLVISLGRIDPNKGNDRLIRGFGEFLRLGGEGTLAVIGPDIGALEGCRQIVAELDIGEHVRFPGFMAGDDKNAALADASLLAQMSIYENGPRVPFEALLAGTPVMTSEGTGSTEALQDIGWPYGVDGNSPQQVGAMLKDISQRYADVKDEASLARQRVLDGYSIAAISSKMTALYAGVIAKV